MTGHHWTERLARAVTPDLAICNSHFTGRSIAAVYPGLSPVIVYAPVEMPETAAVDRSAVRAALSTASGQHPSSSRRAEARNGRDNESLLEALVALA
jgi:hypothetical protein